jgi:uncharacterized protein
MNNPVGWFEIYVEDMARAKTFYDGDYGHIALVIDTEGNMIGLHSFK